MTWVGVLFIPIIPFPGKNYYSKNDTLLEINILIQSIKPVSIQQAHLFTPNQPYLSPLKSDTMTNNESSKIL